MPLPEFAGVLGNKRAAHLLRRATFGATRAQIESFAELTPEQAIASLFENTLPDPLPPLDLQTGTEWLATGPTEANSSESTLETYFLSWNIAQMMSAGISEELSLAFSARERIIFFLHSHFTTIKSKVANTRSLYFQNQLFRKFALDGLTNNPDYNFKNLTVKVSVDNAMLRLLDGELNVSGNPNENYARELLELYTIGRGLEGTVPDGLAPGDYYVYTEADVQEAAKILSGWSTDDNFSNIDPDTGLPRGIVKGSSLNASSHDNTTKTFSERFNNATIAPDPLLLNGGNPTEASAIDEIKKLIDLVYSKPETAKNICWKIYRFFVYAPHEKFSIGNNVAFIDDEIITSMAETFVASGYKILPVIQNLLRSEHFYDSNNSDVIDDNFGGIIKSPLDLVVGTLRSFGYSLPAMTTSLADFYMVTGEILGNANDLGMSFYEPYDVAGYDAYHQWPIYHRAWITPSSLALRYNFVNSLFNSANPGILNIDALQYVSTYFSGEASDARQLIIAVAKALFPVTDDLNFDDATDDTSALTSQRLNYFKERFLQGFDESYWTTRWNEGAGDLKQQLEFLFNAMLQSPEYQLA